MMDPEVAHLHSVLAENNRFHCEACSAAACLVHRCCAVGWRRCGVFGQKWRSYTCAWRCMLYACIAREMEKLQKDVSEISTLFRDVSTLVKARPLPH
jgi:hypothetical protein